MSPRVSVKKGINLTTKITLSVVAVVVFVMVLSSWVIIQRQTKELTEQMKQEADILADAMGLNLSKIMSDRSNNREYKQRMTEELGKVKGVKQIEVYDLNRVVIADTDREEVGQVHSGPDAEDVIKVLQTGEPVSGTEIKEGEEVYSKTIPIFLEKEGKKELIGVAEISMSLTEIAELVTVKEQADILATIVAMNLQKVMGDNLSNQEYMQRLTEELGRQSGVSQIEVYDTTRKIIADTDRNELGQIAEFEDVKEVLETGKETSGFEVMEGEEVYSKTVPIYAEGEEGKNLAGAVEVAMSVPYLKNLVAATRNQIMGLALLIIIAISFVFLLLLRRGVISPVLSLVGVTREMAKGDLSQRAQVRSRDEIGELASSFNEMADEIQKRNEELQTTNEELRVSNEELEQSNEELQSTTEELETSNEELKQTQDQLIQKEKLAAVGQLASGVGHELRNPLGVIKNAAYYLKTKLAESPDPKLAKHLEIMDREINNANKIISDLLGFSRVRPPAITPQDINKVLEESLEAIEMPENVKLVKELGPNLPRAMADPDQMRQVFVNLVLNAVQAMENGGELRLHTRRRDHLIETVVADTGCGIPQENLQKLFDPFFTTKAKGIGLGLAVTKGIIEKHSGEIEVTSQVGKGTSFIVRLPTEGAAKAVEVSHVQS